MLACGGDAEGWRRPSPHWLCSIRARQEKRSRTDAVDTVKARAQAERDGGRGDGQGGGWVQVQAITPSLRTGRARSRTAALDPVEAEDGRLYERAAIEAYFEHKADQVMVKSL